MTDHAARTAAVIEDLIRREGGYVFTNNPHDRGGPTFAGITQRAWMRYAQSMPPSAAAPLPLRVIDLQPEHVRAFYATVHVEPFDWIEDDRLHTLLVDCGVLHGVGRATMWLQRAAGVEEDGVAGPITREAVLAANSVELHKRVLSTRFDFLARIVKSDMSQALFLPGWIARCCEFL